MDNPEKNRVAKTVVDRWCSFHEALDGTKRKYSTREFLSFAEAARSYIDLTRHDQLIHRCGANTINGLTEFLGLEIKRVPGRILSEADWRVRSALGMRRTSRPVEREDCSPQLPPLVRNTL